MRKHGGYSLVELLVVMGIIAILCAILFPVMLKGIGKGQEAVCIVNLEKIHQAVLLYKQDNGVYPEPDDPMAALVSAKVSKSFTKVLTCPEDQVKDNDTYGQFYNYWGYAIGAGNPQPITSKDQAKAVYAPLVNPATGTADYWSTNPIDPDADGPNSAFPGLANPNAPPSTIITVCPHHTSGSKTNYLVLRLGGGKPDEIGRPTSDNYWTLSQSAE